VQQAGKDNKVLTIQHGLVVACSLRVQTARVTLTVDFLTLSALYGTMVHG